MSDENLKENIKPLGSTLNKLLKIESKRYNYKKTLEANSIPDFEVLSEKETFGFIAQDLEKLFPELVLAPNPTNNYYSVNYIGMIPVLLEAIKEQQTIIEELQQQIENLEVALIRCCYINSIKEEENSSIQHLKLTEQSDIQYDNQKSTTCQPSFDTAEEMKVYQNAPNPFNELTTIQCYIPQNIQKAEVCIYNMQGIQVKCFTVFERGTVNVQIEAGQLSSGIYTYLLVGNGKTSDAKQMILTK